MVNQTNGHGVNQEFISFIDRGAGTFSDNNTSWTVSLNGQTVSPNVYRSRGKWYMECTCGLAGQSRGIGIVNSSFPYNQHLGFQSTSWGYFGASGGVQTNNSTQVTYATFTTNDVMAVAFDLLNNRLYFRKNGVWQNSADPANNTGGITIAAGSWSPAVSSGGSTSSATISWTKANFGQWPTIYAPPNGFSLFS
jgi:hypothetical protein